MSNIPVIGLTGKARVGKDTSARFIITARGGYQYALAEPLKAMIRVGFGIDMNDPYWLLHKEDVIPAIGKSPRELLQTLGTEWGRNMVGENTWLIMAKQRLLNLGPGMIISDVRFDNEAEWVRTVGGLVIHVYNNSAERVRQHSSEVGVSKEPGDGEIYNNGTMEELQSGIMERFGK